MRPMRILTCGVVLGLAGACGASEDEAEYHSPPARTSAGWEATEAPDGLETMGEPDEQLEDQQAAPADAESLDETPAPNRPDDALDHRIEAADTEHDASEQADPEEFVEDEVGDDDAI